MSAELLKTDAALTAVPLKMDLIDADPALDTMLGTIAETCNVTSQAETIRFR